MAEHQSRKMSIGLKLTVVVLSLAIAIYALKEFHNKEPEHIFPGVHGPSSISKLSPPAQTKWEDFNRGENSRLAVLLFNTDSAWLGLAHGLKSIGIPFRVTRDYREALRHKVVLIYSGASSVDLTHEEMRALSAFPASGGTLIGIMVKDDLKQVFGFAQAIQSNSRHQISLSSSNSITKIFQDPHERVFPFSSKASSQYASVSMGYLNPKDQVAKFEDGTAAIISHSIGTGMTYAFGVDLGFLLLTGYNNMEQEVSRTYVNSYEPTLDVFLRLIKEIYKAHEPAAVTLNTVPEGKLLTAIMTHDIDYGPAVKNAVEYAKMERSLDINATYFVQTKYIQDWNDFAFFNNETISYLASLRSMGMEVASHSVCHSLLFNSMPLGVGDETYPEYHPYIRDKKHTDNASVFGELRVSRFLLEQVLPGFQVESFRAGYLRIPSTFSQMLEATGYKYDSSVTANNALTHLPFRLSNNLYQNFQTNIFEFPVTIEDQESPSLVDRFQSSIDIADRLAQYGGLFVLLIHPDAIGEKLDYERKFIKANHERAWFGALREFGAFWSARDDVEVDVQTTATNLRVSINSPQKIQGLTLSIPSGFQVTSSIPSNLSFSQNQDKVVIHNLYGNVVLTMSRKQ